MLLNLVREQAKKNIKIHVICLSENGVIGDRLSGMGIPVTSIGMRSGQLNLTRLIKLRQIIRIIDPDILQTWMYHANFVGTLAGFGHHYPIIWSLHHTLGKTEKFKATTSVIIKINSILSKYIPQTIVCCSKATYFSHLEKGYEESKMVVIPNGIDIQEFHSDQIARASFRDELKLGSATQLIGMIGRFHPLKDHQTFIKAAAIINSSKPNIHFILAGKGIELENQELYKWIEAAGLEKVFHLLGLRDDIPRILTSLDLASLISHGEGFPVSICEAMACEVPCVVTDVGDLREIVGQTGICVEPEKPYALAEGWEKLLILSDEEFSNLKYQARLRIATEYNISKIAEKYMGVYDNFRKEIL